MKAKLILFVIFVGWTLSAKADYINDGKFQYYGKIVYIDAKSVKIQLNCNGAIKEFTWPNIMGLTFNDQCSHDGPFFTSSPVTADLNCPKQTVFTMQFKGLPDQAYASSLKYDNNKLVITFARNKGSYTINSAQLKDKLEWMVFGPVCESEIPTDFAIPK